MKEEKKKNRLENTMMRIGSFAGVHSAFTIFIFSTSSNTFLFYFCPCLCLAAHRTLPLLGVFLQLSMFRRIPLPLGLPIGYSLRLSRNPYARWEILGLTNLSPVEWVHTDDRRALFRRVSAILGRYPPGRLHLLKVTLAVEDIEAFIDLESLRVGLL